MILLGFTAIVAAVGKDLWLEQDRALIRLAISTLGSLIFLSAIPVLLGFGEVPDTSVWQIGSLVAILLLGLLSAPFCAYLKKSTQNKQTWLVASLLFVGTAGCWLVCSLIGDKSSGAYFALMLMLLSTSATMFIAIVRRMFKITGKYGGD